MEYYEEQKAALNISVKTEPQDNLIVQGNTMLAEILVQTNEIQCSIRLRTVSADQSPGTGRDEMELDELIILMS